MLRSWGNTGSLKIDGLPPAIPPRPDLGHKGIDFHPFIMTPPRDGVGHFTGHHGMILINHPYLQIAPLYVDEAQEAADMVEQFGLALSDSGGVNMRHIIRDEQGQCLHIIGQNGRAARLLCSEDFLFHAY